jgi:hypothetical protein
MGRFSKDLGKECAARALERQLKRRHARLGMTRTAWEREAAAIGRDLAHERWGR